MLVHSQEHFRCIRGIYDMVIKPTSVWALLCQESHTANCGHAELMTATALDDKETREEAKRHSNANSVAQKGKWMTHQAGEKERNG